MSIADKITQLTNIRAAIRTALQNKGIAAAVSHNFADFAADIAAIATGANLQAKSVSPSTSQQVVSPDSGYDGLSSVTVAGAPLQTRTVTPTAAGLTVEKSSSSWYGLFRVNVNGDSNLVAGNIKSGVSIFGVAGSYAPSVVTQEKSVTPTASQQEVTPDSGKYLSKVTVAAAPLETKSVTPSTAQQTISPSSGKIGMSQVTVAAAPLETKTVTPTAAAQIVSPSSGKIGMSQVTVAATPLQAKSVTPSASQQVITPGSTYVGLSKVTVAGDADLVAGNIKSGVNIFGVTGTYAPASTPINGSLIVATCSSDITSVSTTISGVTYTAYLDTSTHTAYLTIPYTITSGTITVNGYSNGTLMATANITLNGINKYTTSLTHETVLYNRGTWYNYSPTFTEGEDVTMSEDSIQLRIIANRTIQTGISETIKMTPSVSPVGFSEIKFNIVNANATYPVKFVVSASSSSAPVASAVEITSAGEFVYTIPTDLRGSPIYFWWIVKGRPGYNTVVCTINKIEFV